MHHNNHDHDASAMLLLALALSRPSAYSAVLPKGSTEFRTVLRSTQSVSRLDGRDVIARVRVTDPKWTVPGGLLGVSGWKVKKYRLVPDEVKYSLSPRPVKNSSGVTQDNMAVVRSYPDGSRFDELLYNEKTGKVFEHRVRMKKAGIWHSHVEFADKTQRPEGYKGLTQTCMSCHSQTATGTYGSDTGLVPGGDTIISDPLDFGVTEKMNAQPPPRPVAVQPLYSPQPLQYSYPMMGPAFTSGRRFGGGCST